jgi:hypothetical protein
MRERKREGKCRRKVRRNVLKIHDEGHPVMPNPAADWERCVLYNCSCYDQTCIFILPAAAAAAAVRFIPPVFVTDGIQYTHREEDREKKHLNYIYPVTARAERRVARRRRFLSSSFDY